MVLNLPPPPSKSSQGFDDPYFHNWVHLLWEKVSKPGNINATQIGGVISSNNLPAPQLLTGDVTTDSNGVATLTAVNSFTGNFGNSASIPSINVDEKGRITSASSVSSLIAVSLRM